MSASSDLMVLEEVAGNPFTEDDPTSTYRAWATRNNLAHLIDESTQVRINWVASSVNGESNDSYRIPRIIDIGSEIPIVIDTGLPRIWSQEFPITWLLADRPANLDLHVRVATNAETPPTLSVRARVVPARFPLGDTTCPVFVEETAATTSDPDPAAVINAQLLLTVPAPELESYLDLPFAVEEDGVFITPRMELMRLELTLQEAPPLLDHSVHEIVSVYLREYA